MYLARFPRY